MYCGKFQRGLAAEYLLRSYHSSLYAVLYCGFCMILADHLYYVIKSVGFVRPELSDTVISLEMNVISISARAIPETPC